MLYQDPTTVRQFARDHADRLLAESAAIRLVAGTEDAPRPDGRLMRMRLQLTRMRLQLTSTRLRLTRIGLRLASHHLRVPVPRLHHAHR
jgi:hypothetical protein